VNWDTPSFPPKDVQINESMVMLALSGPGYQTGHEPMAWGGDLATKAAANFEAKKGFPPRAVQAWKATFGADRWHPGGVRRPQDQLRRRPDVDHADQRSRLSVVDVAGNGK